MQINTDTVIAAAATTAFCGLAMGSFTDKPEMDYLGFVANLGAAFGIAVWGIVTTRNNYDPNDVPNLAEIPNAEMG